MPSAISPTASESVIPVDDPDATSGRRVSRNFLTLGAGEILARLVAFAGMVYLARVLGAEAQGIIGFALAVTLYLARLADGGMEFFGLGIQLIAEDPRRLHSVAPSLIGARLLIAAGCVLVLVILAQFLPSPDGTVLALYGTTLITVAFGTRWIFLGLQVPLPVALARAAGEIVMVLLVVALVHGPEDVVRAPLAQLAGDFLAALLLVWGLTRRGWRPSVRLDWKIAYPILRRAAPLIASGMLGLMIYNSDLIMLRFFRDSAAVGYYAVAYALISFLLNLGTTYGQSLLPILARQADAAARRQLYQTALAQVSAVTVPIALGGCLVASQMIDVVFGPAYAASTIALQLLLWSIPLGLLREVATTALIVSGSRSRILRLTGASATLNILLNLVLIPVFGIPGAAVATIATEALRLALSAAYANRTGFGLLPAARLGRVVLAAGAMGGVLVLTGPPLLWIALPLGGLAYGLTLLLLGGIRLQRHALPELTV